MRRAVRYCLVIGIALACNACTQLSGTQDPTLSASSGRLVRDGGLDSRPLAPHLGAALDTSSPVVLASKGAAPR